ARGGTVWSPPDGGAHWRRVRLRSGPQEVADVGCGGRDAWVVFHEGAAAGTEGYHVFRSRAGAPWRAGFASPFQRKLPSVSSYIGPFVVLRHGGAVLTGSCAPCGAAGTATPAPGCGRAPGGGPGRP